MNPHLPLLAALRPASYRELPRLRRPVAIGAALVIGALPVTAALTRDRTPAAAPAAVSPAAERLTEAVSRAQARRLDVAEHPSGSAAARAARASRAGARPPVARPMRTRTVARVTFEQRGRASWYGPGFHGRRTASGERFDTGEMTAAHRTLPFGSRARVCTKRRCVNVRINDRGPYIRGRVVDLSRAAARALGIEGSGVARVTVTVVRTTTVTEPVPVAARRMPPPRPARPAAAPPVAPRVAAPRVAAPRVAAPVLAAAPATMPVALAGEANDSVDAAGAALVGSMVFLLWAAPAVAARRRREGLDFLR